MAAVMTYVNEQAICLFARLVSAWSGRPRTLPWLLDLSYDPGAAS
jgi:hypothetical protein